MPARLVRPVRGYSVALNGTNTRIEMGNNLGFERTASRTFGYWILGGLTGHPFSKQNMAGQIGYSSYHSLGQVQFYLQGSPTGANATAAGTSNVVLSDTVWTSVLITYDGTSLASGINFYVGTNSAQSKATLNNNLSATIITTTSFTLGARPGPAGWIPARMKNIAIWDKVLDSGERDAFFTAGLLGDLSSVATANRLAYYDPRLGDNLASTLPDLDVGFDGTCVNMTAVNLRPIYDGSVRAT